MQIGDEVEVLLPGMDCNKCNNLKPLLYPDSHFVIVEKGVVKGIYCSKCAESEETRILPISLIRPVIEGKQIDRPRKGSFKPIDTPDDEPESGAYAYWMETGHLILEEMVTFRERVLKFSIGGNRYKGLWVKPHWDNSRVVRLTIAGDTPSKNLELDVYQTTRLTQMGFEESGRTNKTWEMELSDVEGDVSNASSIILHLLRYGYLLEPSDLATITPTLDLDFSDPEWKHLKEQK